MKKLFCLLLVALSFAMIANAQYAPRTYSSVSVTNWPSSLGVSGTVSIGNWLELQNVGGVYHAIAPSLSDGQASALLLDSDNSLIVNVKDMTAPIPAGSNQIGSVLVTNTTSTSIINWPSSQTVTGTISIGNFPSSQAVTGTFWQSIQPISGSVSVGNFPASYPFSDAGVQLSSTVAITANGQSTSAIAVAGYNSVNVIAFGTFSTVNITPQISADGGTTWQGILQTRLDATNAASALTTGNQSTGYTMIIPTLGATHIRFTSTAWTSGQLNLRVTPSLANDPQPYITTIYNGTQGINITQLNAATPNTDVTQGSTNKGLGVLVSGVSNITMTTTAYGGAGRVNGATQAVANGHGVSACFDINLSTWTAGTASGIQFFIEQSNDNGTTWNTVSTTDSINATGHIYTPAQYLQGRFRISANSIGGTSTTATTAINVMLGSSTPPVWLKTYTDYYNATNPTTIINNGVTSTSTLASTTLNSAGAIVNVEGCKMLSISGVFTGGTPTTAPVYTLYVGNDTANMLATSCTFSPTGAGTFGATMANVCWKFAKIQVTTASAGGTAYGVTKTQINGSN